MRALKKNHTQSVEALPTGKTTVGRKWVFIVKLKFDGLVERYKMAQGFTHTFSILQSKTFSLVTKLNAVRVLLSLTANLD